MVDVAPPGVLHQIPLWSSIFGTVVEDKQGGVVDQQSAIFLCGKIPDIRAGGSCQRKDNVRILLRKRLTGSVVPNAIRNTINGVFNRVFRKDKFLVGYLGVLCKVV